MSSKKIKPIIVIKRIYESASPNDGARILVDRIWPRGVSKQDAAIDHWAKDIAPSTELRKWFGHDPEKWTEFQRRYRNELKPFLPDLHELLKTYTGRTITLVFAAKDTEHNQAVVLKDVLDHL